MCVWLWGLPDGLHGGLCRLTNGHVQLVGTPGGEPRHPATVTGPGRCRHMGRGEGKMAKNDFTKVPRWSVCPRAGTCKEAWQGCHQRTLRNIPEYSRIQACASQRPIEILPPGSRWRPDESTPAHTTQITHTVTYWHL